MKLTTLAFAAALTPLGALFAQAQEAPKYFFEGDTVRGGGPTAQGPGCALNSQFKRKEAIVWRIRILDPKTGKSLDDKAIKNLSIELANGEKVPMSYHAHPPRGDATDYFWSGGWIVPENQPTGSFTYKVMATDTSGSTVTWKPFNVVASQLTVVAN